MFQKYVLICFLLKFHHLLKLILENINNFGKGTTYTNGAKNDGKTHACRLVTIVTNSLLQFIDKILTINWFVEKINKFKNRNELSKHLIHECITVLLRFFFRVIGVTAVVSKVFLWAFEWELARGWPKFTPCACPMFYSYIVLI